MTTNEPPVGPGPEEPTENTPPPPPPPAAPPVYGSYTDPGAPPPPPPGFGPAVGGTGPYSAVEAAKFGWAKFTNNPGPWVLTLVLMFAVTVFLSIVTMPLTSSGNPTDLDSLASLAQAGGFSFVGTLVNIAISAVAYILSALLVRGSLDETEGTKFSISSAFSRLDIVPVLLLGILLSIGTTIGTMLCFLPGIAFSFFTMFSLFYLIDRNVNPIEAIVESAKLVAGKLGESILTFLVMAGVIILGILACCIGLIAAIPVAQIALAYAYKRLNDQPVA